MMYYLVNNYAGKYQKLTKPPENENTTEIIEIESLQDELASDDNFLLHESPKKKLNSTLKSTGVSPVNKTGVSQHSCASNGKGKLKKVLSTRRTFLLHVLDIETEEPPPIYDRDTKNKAKELDSLHAAMKEKLVTKVLF